MRKLQTYLKQLLNTKLETHEWALCISIALFTVLFPIYGLTTIAVTYIAYLLKINLAVTIGLTWLFEPLRFAFFIPFTKTGAYLLGEGELLFSIDILKELNFGNLFAFLTHQFKFAFVGWLCIATPLCLLVYYLLKSSIFSFRKQKTVKII